MVRVLKIKRMYRRILGYLARGDPTPFILQNTGLKEANYYKKLKTLEKYEYITKKRVGKILDIQLQPRAIKELGMVSVGAKRVEYINLHDVWVACEIIKKPCGWGKKDFVEKILETKGFEYSTNKINNWKGLYFDYASVLVRVTPNKILFHPPQIELEMTDSPEHAKNIMLKYIKGIIPKIENWFKVTITRPNRISMSVSSQHIAFVKNQIAQYFANNGIDLRIYDDEGKLRVIVDESRGPELETVNKAYAEEDAEKLKNFIKDTVTGQFDHRQINRNLACAAESINRIAQNQETFSGDMVEYGQKISSHAKSIEVLGDGINKLTNLVERIENVREAERANDRRPKVCQSADRNIYSLLTVRENIKAKYTAKTAGKSLNKGEGYMKKKVKVKKAEEGETSKKGPKPFFEETICCAWCGKPNIVSGIKETVVPAVPAQRKIVALVEKDLQKKLNE